MSIWIVTGLWVVIGCAQAAHLITIMTDRSLQTYTLLCGVFVLAGLIIYISCVYLLKKKGRLSGAERSGKSSGSSKMYKSFFAVMLVFTCVHFIRGYVPDLQDAVYEITLGNLESGSIMSVHPFLGQAVENTMPMRMQIPGLSSLYSVLVTISQQSPYIILCKIVPLALWVCTMLLYRAFAEKLFPKDDRRQWLFLSFAAFFLLITSKSPGMPGYRLFFAGFSQESIRGILLLPYTLYVSWQRKRLLTVVALLAEICLVWTTYGIGYCAVAAACMWGVHLWSDRRCKHAS